MAYRLVGYFENWAQYRQAGGKFLPNQIDPTLLTHINFAFAIFGFITKSVDPSNPRLTGDYTVQPVEWNDQSVLYPAIQALKTSNPALKTLLSIGGWSFNDPQDINQIGTVTYQLFSQMAASEAGRSQFIDSALSYAQKYGFDGIDIDWEYPGYIGRGGTPEDLGNFLALTQELRAAAPSGFLLTMAAPAIVPTGEPDQYHQDPGSFFGWLAQCAQQFDWLNMMCYDYHGAFDSPSVGTGVNAPLLQDSTPNGPYSIKNSVEAYLAAQIPPAKMVLGMPTYGRSYTVTSALTANDNGPGQPFSGAGPAGPATGIPGVLAYYEIQQQLASGSLTRGWDSGTLTPYAYGGTTWVSYDDPKSLGYKVSYLIEEGLGGAMVWSIDDDSFAAQASQMARELARAAGPARRAVATNRTVLLETEATAAVFPLLSEVNSILDNPNSRPPLPSDNPLPGDSFGTGTQYDMGTNPCVAVNSQDLVVEIHSVGPDGPPPGVALQLWSRVGTVSGDSISWSAGSQYDSGHYFSVAINNLGQIVEVHTAQQDGSLYYHVGSIAGNAITWGPAIQFDSAAAAIPAVALTDDGVVVEVHRAASQFDTTVSYRVGSLTGNTINWGPSTPYTTIDGALTLALAVNNNGQVVEVHSPSDITLAYQAGSLAGNTINWGPSTSYDTGLFASIALTDDGQVIEVHADDGGGPLWCRFGTLDGTTINWGAPKQQYGTGWQPHVACNGTLAVEVHESLNTNTINQSLYYSVLSLSATPSSSWLEANGPNSYCYCACTSPGSASSLSRSHTMNMQAGAPYFYAVLTKDDGSTDFPTGAVLTIQGPDGTNYNNASDSADVFVMMSGSSIQCLIVKDPLPGDWQMTVTAPAGVGFHCECNSVPSTDVYNTITQTLTGLPSRARVPIRDLGNPVAGWLGAGALTAIALAGATPVVGVVHFPLLLGAFIIAVIAYAIAQIATIDWSGLFSDDSSTEIASDLQSMAKANSGPAVGTILLPESNADQATQLQYAQRQKKLYPFIAGTKYASSQISLVGEQDSRANVQMNLQNSAIVFCSASGHGAPRFVTGRLLADGTVEPILTAGQYEPALAQNKIFHFFSCNCGTLSATAIGADLVKNGAKAFFGYSDPFIMSVGVPGPFVECDSAIDKALLSGSTTGEAYTSALSAYDSKINRYLENGVDPNIPAWLEMDRNRLVGPGVNGTMFGDPNATLGGSAGSRDRSMVRYNTRRSNSMDSLVKEKVKAAGLLELPAGYHKVSNQIVLLKDVIDRLDDLRSLNELSGSEREMLAIQRWKAGGWSDVLYCEQLVTLDRAVNEVTKHTKMGQDLVKGSIRAIEMMLVHLQKNNPPSGTP